MKLFRLFRMKEWFVAKLSFNSLLMICCLFLNHQSISENWLAFLLFFSYLLFTGTFGYFLNDLTDRKSDAAAGKVNMSGVLILWQSIVLLGLLFVLSFLPVLFLKNGGVYALLLAAQYVLILSYSLPYIRLKTHVLGVFCDALYSYVLPAIIAVFLVFDTHVLHINTIFYPLVVWLFFIGLRSILSHQRGDYEVDKTAGQRTFVLRLGQKFSRKIHVLSFDLELLAFVVVCAFLPLGLLYALMIGLAMFLLFDVFLEKQFPFLTLKSSMQAVDNLYNIYFITGLGLYYAITGQNWAWFVLLYFLFVRFYPFQKSIVIVPIRWFSYKWKGLLKRLGKK